jgi:hypothetical protein
MPKRAETTFSGGVNINMLVFSTFRVNAVTLRQAAPATRRDPPSGRCSSLGQNQPGGHAPARIIEKRGRQLPLEENGAHAGERNRFMRTAPNA